VTQTPEDVSSEYVRLMGDELGLLFHELTREEEWLSDKWAVFQELFEKGSERIDLLNRAAAHFFVMLHKMLYEDAMLHLSRLTDPPKSSVVKTNLTVRLLPDLISDQVLKDSVEADIGTLRKTCEFARDLRNRRLAHYDLKTVRNEHPLALPSVTSKDITQALQCLRALLSSIEKHYRGRDISVLSLGDPWGAKSLVDCLESAVRAQDEKKNQQP
jgi:AbiU2